MEIGMRIKQARLEMGLSQRQLCGDVITRNMLSLIESGKAKPSMDTLSYLAEKLGKPMGYFLDGQMDHSPVEQAGLALARQCQAALVGEKKNNTWLLTQGFLAFSLGEYAQAAEFLSRVEHVFPDAVIGALEVCYRELGDFQKAYVYACKQKS